MKRYYYTAFLLAPDPKIPGEFRHYSHLRVIATCEAEARALVERHLAERKPLGFSEAEIRKPYPKRTPWTPGIKIFYIMESAEARDDESSEIPF
jgi:hypothetical protein